MITIRKAKSEENFNPAISHLKRKDHYHLQVNGFEKTQRGDDFEVVWGNLLFAE